MSLDINTPPRTTGYLLLFRGSHREDYGQSEAGIRQAMDKMKAWMDGLSAAGKMVSAQPLMEEGVVISGEESLVTDGPFAEAKEAIGGFILLSVETMEEAVAIAKANPMHAYGISTEVRPTASSCPHTYRALSRLAAAAA